LIRQSVHPALKKTTRIFFPFFFTIFGLYTQQSGTGDLFMDYKLTIEPKPSYLHIIVTGRNSKHAVIQYLEEILRECKAHNCYRILVEERLEGPRLGTVDIFRIVSEESSSGIGILKAIAYVDVYAESNLMKFAETVAFNRSLPVRVFSAVADAEHWLLNEDSGGRTNE
jgi:hypothetical protein